MRSKPRLLDLFCGAGGAGEGFSRAGFEVVGVDIEPQPDYPFEFHQADAVDFLRRLIAGETVNGWRLEDFAVIHASPPCQAYTAMGVMWNARNDHPELVDAMRDLLLGAGLPYVIENVPGAPMNGGHFTLCGSAFGLGAGEYELRRHRHFETSFAVLVPPCQHHKPTLGIYGDHARDRRRVEGDPNPERGRQFPAGVGLDLAREAMEMPWANWRGLSQAIPPAYTEHIGGHLMAVLQLNEAA